MSTNFFVVQAQRDLLDAQISELRAALNYQKALVAFERVQQTAAADPAPAEDSTMTGQAYDVDAARAGRPSKRSSKKAGRV